MLDYDLKPITPPLIVGKWIVYKSWPEHMLKAWCLTIVDRTPTHVFLRTNGWGGGIVSRYSIHQFYNSEWFYLCPKKKVTGFGKFIKSIEDSYGK